MSFTLRVKTDNFITVNFLNGLWLSRTLPIKNPSSLDQGTLYRTLADELNLNLNNLSFKSVMLKELRHGFLAIL